MKYRSKDSLSAWAKTAMACFLGLMVAGCGKWAYLTPKMVSGTYVFVEGEISDTIRLYTDATYEQELKIGDAVYTSKARYSLNEGGAVIFRHLYTRFTDDGEPLNPPKKKSVCSSHWYSDGTIKFVLHNPNFNDGAGPGFIASDKYYVKRVSKK